MMPCVPRTVGIDLAAQDKGTASCAIEWSKRTAKISVPQVGRSDDALVDDLAGTDVAGIDAPFGWPEPFARAVAAHRAGKSWPGRGKPLAEYRQDLRLRCTDFVVKREASLTPLSVSADKIAVTTFRCAVILDRLEHEQGWVIDRAGTSGKVVEVYPAAALKQWRLLAGTSYKAAAAVDERDRLLKALARALKIAIPAPVRDACCATDHALDALVSAVVARAAVLGWTRPPWTEVERTRAIIEGWIHFPHPASAGQLVSGRRGPTDRQTWDRARGARD